MKQAYAVLNMYVECMMDVRGFSALCNNEIENVQIGYYKVCSLNEADALTAELDSVPEMNSTPDSYQYTCEYTATDAIIRVYWPAGRGITWDFQEEYSDAKK